MTGTILLPALVLLPMAGALMTYLIGRKNKNCRNLFAVLVTIAEFAMMIRMLIPVCAGEKLTCELPLLLGGLRFETDGFRGVYATVAGLMWMMTSIFSAEYLRHYRNRNRYWFFTLLTLGATVGVFLAADLMTAFIFFEIMSFTSWVMVVHDENPAAMRAGQTYLAVAVLGGMVMLMGLFLLSNLTGTLRISELRAACAAVPAERRTTLYLAGSLILFGYGAKAGMFPLHIWLPKAHPAAPAPASALLSGILTKAGIFGVLVLSGQVFLHDAGWGSALLILGEATMLLGAVLAVFSVNLKRTLACSSVSQIGFILTGIGMQCLLGEENGLAVWGTELHMINHSMFKLVLFMCAGAVYMNTHKLNLNEIRGFGRGKPALMAAFLCGCLGIAGVPLFSGYISKTLLHESIVEYTEVLAEAGRSVLLMKGAEWIFLLSGGLTAAYMTKLFIAVFVEKNADPAVQAKYDALNRKYMNGFSAAALLIPAALLPLMGSTPSETMARIAALGQEFMHLEEKMHAIHWFSWTNLKGAGISLLIGAAVYFGVIRPLLTKKREDGIREYTDRWPSRLDLEEAVYRPLCAAVTKAITWVSGLVDFLGSKGLPGICRFMMEKPLRAIAAVPDALTDNDENKPLPRIIRAAVKNLFRGIAGIPDAASVLAEKTILRRIPIPAANPEDAQPDDLAVHDRIPKKAIDVMTNFSYGLILFGLGLAAVVLYLILRN